VQELVAKESDELLKVNLEDQRREGTLEAATSEAAKGISPPYTIFDNLTELDTSSPLSSSDTSSIPSPSNQTSEYVPMYPSVKSRIDDMI